MYWKLFTFFLDDNKYKEGIVDIAKNINENLPPIDRWEHFKHKVKEFSIEFAKSNQLGIFIYTNVNKSKICKYGKCYRLKVQG